MSTQQGSAFSSGFTGCFGVGCAVLFGCVALPIIAFFVMGVLGITAGLVTHG